MSDLQRFSQRLQLDWLMAYCKDAKRNYDPKGFKETSITVAEADAKDCMLAIDHGVVSDTGGGRYRANRSSAQEVLFWEGRKTKTPRTITLWVEPVITFAALARLHLVHGWPKQQLGMQPKGWAFDLAAYSTDADLQPRILGEVKKSGAELDRLRGELLRLADGASPESVSSNSAKKWRALLTMRPRTIWLLGPNDRSHIYSPLYAENGCTLQETTEAALAHSAA